MGEKWQRLHLANGAALPALLFKYSPTTGGYELLMTDLSNIWSERLNCQAILRRADEDDTTIDPSEDSEQFKVLLQKIGAGLQHEPGSSTTLSQRRSPRSQGNENGDTLELTVLSELPAPLKPLKWRLCLAKEPQSSSTSHLLLPFIKAEADRESRQRTLIDELHKKDWVLGKLFDKIEAIGIDLSTVFPGTSGLRAGRKCTSLTHAAKFIKGLAPFDEQTWVEEVNKACPTSAFAANVVAEIRGGSQDTKALDGLEPPPDEWWEGLTISDSTPAPSAPHMGEKVAERKKSAKAMVTDSDTGTESEDDDFERQETPPRLKKRGEPARQPPSPKEDEDTQSDEEPLQPIRRKLPTGQTKKGLGTIGGKRQVKQKEPSPSPSLSPSPSPSPSPSSSSPTLSNRRALSPPHDDDETTDAETDSETDGEDSPHKPQSRLPKTTTTKATTAHKDKGKPPPATKPSRGLGVIGGKKKKQEPEPEPEPKPAKGTEPPTQDESSIYPEPQIQQPSESVKKKKPAGKLGVIGGRHKGAKPSAEGERASSSLTESVCRLPKEEEGTKEEEQGDAKQKPAEKKSAPVVTQEQKKRRTPSAEPDREETEQEKADRKREELKRQLEAKSKAPVKKKRRF